MASVPNAPWMGFGQDYAKTQAAAYDPTIAAYDPVIAALTKRRDEIAARAAGLPETVGGLFAGAERLAGNVGADVSNIGAGFLGAISGLGSALPGLDTTELANAARSTARAGATGSMLGSVLGTQVGQARATSILEAQARLAAERQAAEDALMQTGLERGRAMTERERVAADWMTPAQQRQQMRTTALQNEQITQEIKSLKTMRPIEVKNALLSNKMLREQIAGQVLTNADARATLMKAGYKVSKDGTVTDPSGNVVFQRLRA